MECVTNISNQPTSTAKDAVRQNSIGVHTNDDSISYWYTLTHRLISNRYVYIGR